MEVFLTVFPFFFGAVVGALLMRLGIWEFEWAVEARAEKIAVKLLEEARYQDRVLTEYDRIRQTKDKGEST